MGFFKVFITAPVSLLLLFVLSKFIGNKQIASLNLFDYINSITIGSIAAEMATSEFSDFWGCMFALIIYAALVFLVSLISQKSVVLRRLLTGKSVVLFDNGKLYKQNLKTAKIDTSELLSMLRVNGYFNFDDISTAILEANGQISILPKADKKPITPSDIKLRVSKEELEKVIICSGKILDKNLKESGNNHEWLNKQLDMQNKKVSEIFLAVCDKNNMLKIIKCTEEKTKNDIFE